MAEEALLTQQELDQKSGISTTVIGSNTYDIRAAQQQISTITDPQKTALATPIGENRAPSQTLPALDNALAELARIEEELAKSPENPNQDQIAAQAELLRQQNKLAEEIARLSPAEIKQLLQQQKLTPDQLAIVLRAREYAGAPHTEEMGRVVLEWYTALEGLGSSTHAQLLEESLVAARANISQISEVGRNQLAQDRPDLLAIYDRVVPLIGETNIEMTSKGQQATTGNVGAFYQNAAAIQAKRLYSDPKAAAQVHDKLEEAMLLGPELTAGKLLKLIQNKAQSYPNERIAKIVDLVRGNKELLAYLHAPENEGIRVSELLNRLAENPSDPRYRDLVAATLAYRSVVVAQDYVTARREIKDNVVEFNQTRSFAELYNARQVRVEGYGKVYSPESGYSGSVDVITTGSRHSSGTTGFGFIPGIQYSGVINDPGRIEVNWGDQLGLLQGGSTSQLARQVSSGLKATDLGNKELADGRELAEKKAEEKKKADESMTADYSAVFIGRRLPGDSLSPELNSRTIQTLNKYGVGTGWVAAGPGRTLIDQSPLAMGSVEQEIEEAQRASQRDLKNGAEAA